MITIPPVAALTAAADQRVRARIAAATAQRERQKQQRDVLAEARQHGLAARHRLKQTRNRLHVVPPDGGPPEAA